MKTQLSLGKIARHAILASIPAVALLASTGDAEARSRHTYRSHRQVACAPRAYYGGYSVVRRPVYRVRRPYVPLQVYAPPVYYVPGRYIYDPYYGAPAGFIDIGGPHVRVAIAF